MTVFIFLRILFILLGIISITFLLPIGVAIFYQEFYVIPAFALPGVICIVLATIFLLVGGKRKFSLTPKDSFLIVAAAWASASLLGSIPFLLSGVTTSFTDAFFESVSGFSTTGATIFSDVESLPKSVNLWRCQMHWLGGMGIVVLTVALLPILGVGGFQLIKAETTGPEKGKVTPKIATTAKILWFMYFAFTVIQTVLLHFAGMDWFESLAHTFSTLGTGGFSTRNTSIAAFNSPAIEWICTVFMFLAGINFSLFFFLVTKKFDELRYNSELKAYLGIIAFSILFITLFLLEPVKSLGNSLREAAFQVAAIISTTGFSSVDFNLWPSTAKFFLFVLMFIGGCSGSTGGGVKVIRWVILSKQTTNEIRRMLHPHGVFTVQLNNRAGRKDVVFSVAAFMFLYFLLVAITTFIASLSGIDLFSSYTAALSMVGNIGPGFGAVGPVENFSFFADGIKLWFCFVMLAGRLELYTMLIFFTPSFWKK
ncbi:MAG: TrkH family potassium uptake protein [Spirochaetaceae bacterium]|nr:TrkH family potassium uptake protein [Spirochaetaceae bacterium]